MFADHKDGLLGSSFNFILESSVSLSAVIQSAGDFVPETLGSNPAFTKVGQLVSFDLFQNNKINNNNLVRITSQLRILLSSEEDN